jgi:hypothetical protein
MSLQRPNLFFLGLTPIKKLPKRSQSLKEREAIVIIISILLKGKKKCNWNKLSLPFDDDKRISRVLANTSKEDYLIFVFVQHL